MITARGEDYERIMGLEIGADDYIVKPFSPREVMACIRAVMRRVQQDPMNQQQLNFDDLTINLENYTVTISKQPILLTKKEIDLLWTLASNRQKAYSRKEKQLTFKVNIDNKPLIFLGDYGRLRQMFLIVLANAIKFSPINSAITVELSANKLTITDQGPGIKEEDLPYIFDRFHKTYGEKNKTGTGLGLAIARQIAQRHAILVTVKNTPTAGARFIFDFSKLERLDVTTLENF